MYEGCYISHEFVQDENSEWRLYAGFGAGTNFSFDAISLLEIEVEAKRVRNLNEKELIKYCNASEKWNWWSDVAGKPDRTGYKWEVAQVDGKTDKIKEVWK